MTSVETGFELSEECIRHLAGHGGRAKFIGDELVNIVWTPTVTTEPVVVMDTASVHEFPRLMRFLRAVEKARLEIEYGCRILASNSGHGEVQIWFEKQEGQDLEEMVRTGACIYEDRFGVEPNVLILNDKDDSDVSFWKGKIWRKQWLLPTHFRLTYKAEDAQKVE